MSNGRLSLRARDPSPRTARKLFVQNKLHQSFVTVGTFVDEKRVQMKLDVLIPAHGDMQHASRGFLPITQDCGEHLVSGGTSGHFDC